MAAAETNEISWHQARLFNYLKTHDGWHTSKTIAEASEVNWRTTRSHLIRFVREGIVDQMELFPGHRYRLSPMAEKRNKTLIQRLREAQQIFEPSAVAARF